MRALALLVLLGGCKDDDDLTLAMGARCVDSTECASFCLTGAVAPGGLCTRACAVDDDCPASALCAPDVSGGVCLYACRDDRDCEFLESSGGVRWTCHDHRLDQGSVLVCLGE